MKTLTCKEFLATLQLPNSWESPISLMDFVDSPECGAYCWTEKGFIIVTPDADEYIISDPDNENQKYPVSVEL